MNRWAAITGATRVIAGIVASMARRTAAADPADPRAERAERIEQARAAARDATRAAPAKLVDEPTADPSS